ncbi:hypothetical protein SOVF_073650 isoform B [Spinacia oleracea]|nr:hypothetical protein SOVF_073650 isoform B [Spinacia oleracea]
MPSVNLSLACDHQFVNVILVFSLCNLGFDIHRMVVKLICQMLFERSFFGSSSWEISDCP